MLIAEELLLLSYDEEGIRKKGIRLLDYGLAGSIIADLVLLKRIKFQGLKINVINSSGTNDELLDEILRLISYVDDHLKIQYWISRIRRNYRKIISISLQRLVNKNILLENEEKRFLVIKKKKYMVIDPSIAIKLKNNIISSLLSDLEPNDKLKFLISLSRTCNIINYQLPSESDQMKIKKRIKSISKEDPISRSIKQLRDDNAAILAITQMSTIYYDS